MEKEYLESLVNEGLTIRQIAARTNKGRTTIGRLLKKYNLQTKGMFNYEKNKSFKYNDNGDILCLCCGVILNDGNCNRTKRGTFRTFCKRCKNIKNNDGKIKFKKRALDYKGGCCQVCGYNKNISALEFHHIDPSQKEVGPADLYRIKWENARKELDKCVILCSNCHREEHYKIDEKKQKENEFSSNLISSFSDKILIGKNTLKHSCKDCDKVLTEENKASGTHRNQCRDCNNKMVINRAASGKKRAVEYMGGCCSVCGYDKCLRALEFHHLDPSKKTETFRRFTLWNFERQKKELENCIIVCSNCHREIHSKDEHKTHP
jgi:hypothetical protein